MIRRIRPSRHIRHLRDGRVIPVNPEVHRRFKCSHQFPNGETHYRYINNRRICGICGEDITDMRYNDQLAFEKYGKKAEEFPIQLPSHKTEDLEEIKEKFREGAAKQPQRKISIKTPRGTEMVDIDEFMERL